MCYENIVSVLQIIMGLVIWDTISKMSLHKDVKYTVLQTNKIYFLRSVLEVGKTDASDPGKEN